MENFVASAVSYSTANETAYRRLWQGRSNHHERSLQRHMEAGLGAGAHDRCTISSSVAGTWLSGHHPKPVSGAHLKTRISTCWTAATATREFVIQETSVAVQLIIVDRRKEETPHVIYIIGLF